MESALQSRQMQGNANNAHTGQVITNLLQVLETDTTCDLGVIIASDLSFLSKLNFLNVPITGSPKKILLLFIFGAKYKSFFTYKFKVEVTLQ